VSLFPTSIISIVNYLQLKLHSNLQLSASFAACLLSTLQQPTTPLTVDSPSIYLPGLFIAVAAAAAAARLAIFILNSAITSSEVASCADF
jgi:hypothetical protein